MTAKRKGSGMLGDLTALEQLLDEVFTGLPGMRLSIKTRIGRYDPAEWEAILRLFEKYPLWELTVHPRVQKEFYKGRAHRDVFLATAEKTALPLVYNGDVTAPADEALTWGCPVMLGRGLMADPALLRRCRGGPPASRRELREYHDRLLAAYTETLFGDTPVLHKMRLLWSYLGASFSGSERYVRAICKARDLSAYRAAAEAILTGCPLENGAGHALPDGVGVEGAGAGLPAHLPGGLLMALLLFVAHLLPTVCPAHAAAGGGSAARRWRNIMSPSPCRCITASARPLPWSAATASKRTSPWRRPA